MEVSMVRGDRLRILRFWELLEAFASSRVPELRSGPGEVQVVEWESGEPLPWETLHPDNVEASPTHRVWRHTVYLGVYELAAGYERLRRSFGDEVDAHRERPLGWGACAAVQLDQFGLVLPGQATLSRALWTIARAEDPGLDDPTWADGFDHAQRQFASAVDRVRVGARGAVRSDTLHAMVRASHEATHMWARWLATSRIVIESALVDEEATVPVSLNSPFLPGLQVVREAVAEDDLGPALSAYLTPDTALVTEGRIDVLADQEATLDGARASLLPLGRWPTDPERPRALREQFAINEITAELVNGGVVGVHAAPGTGRADVMRDLVAANVVERAKRLAALNRPEDAFVGTLEWEADGFPRRVRQLRPELTGFEMVVTSTSEPGVERVVAELDSRGAIHPQWRNSADYFGAVATGVAAALGEHRDAWAMLAARLSDTRQRARFAAAFWPTNGAAAGTLSLKSLLEGWRDGAYHKPWDEARAEFDRAERRVEELLRECRGAEGRLHDLTRMDAQERRLAEVADQASRAAHMAEEELDAYQPLVAEVGAELDKHNEAYEAQLALKPGWFESALSFGKLTRTWRENLAAASDAVDVAIVAKQEVEDRDRQLRETVAQQRAILAQAEADMRTVREDLSRLRARIAEDRARFGAMYPSPDTDLRTRELRAPWLDAALDSARSELFLAALRLHQDFAACTARDMLYGLSAAMDVFTGRHVESVTSEQRLAAWRMFFLAVPVVSAGLAELGPMLGDTGRDALGWLILDEAGQAPPQRAVSAIWRAQRVVSIGDPAQLPPESPLPEGASMALAKACEVSKTWIPPHASAQTLVNRLAKRGASLPGVGWVSAPLRVHRRCDDPMFTLTNRAYGGMLVSDVRRVLDDPRHPDPFDTPSGPRMLSSRWADLPAPTRGSHLQSNQVGLLRGLLGRLGDSGIAMADVLAVSPFRETGERLARLHRDFPGVRGGALDAAQGREADVVVLVLGGDPERPGAKAALPSAAMVNVAAGAARRRLYVIGDRDAWMEHGAFRDLGEMLDVDR